ncbi:MAG TPA: cell division topological specificity factor MinE [Methylophilaceae bacterium]|nr:cell division topological specificity factor MinE [Methylophilaceae bacterium]
MSIFNYLFGTRKTSASLAKERLQIILAHEHSGRPGTPDYLPAMKQEILAVIAKYIDIDLEKINVSLDRQDDVEVLELNIVLPEPQSRR